MKRKVNKMTVTLFGSTCSSSKKAIQWFMDHDIPYEFRHIVHEPLTEEEFFSILEKTEQGTEEIISTRSEAYQNLNVDFASISLKKLYTYIREYPTLLRRPIMLDKKRVLVGYDVHEIRQFLPRNMRQFLWGHPDILPSHL